MDPHKQININLDQTLNDKEHSKIESEIIDDYKKRITSNESSLYFVKSNNKRHNIFGLWSIELLKLLENDLINNNFRKVEDWANKIGVKTINIETKKFDPFFNINTKEDLEEAKKILKKN